MAPQLQIAHMAHREGEGGGCYLLASALSEFLNFEKCFKVALIINRVCAVTSVWSVELRHSRGVKSI